MGACFRISQLWRTTPPTVRLPLHPLLPPVLCDPPGDVPPLLGPLPTHGGRVGSRGGPQVQVVGTCERRREEDRGGEGRGGDRWEGREETGGMEGQKRPMANP